MLLLLTLSTVATIVLIRQLMLVALDEEITTQFMQEQEEFRRLAGGIDPRTGEPFGGDLRRIFDVFFSRNVPDEEEAMLSFVEGDFYKSRAGPDVTYPIQRDRDVVARWVSADRPLRGELETPAGPARYIAVPVLRGEASAGTFVVVNFPATDLDEVEFAVRVVGGVGLGVLVLASLLGWSVAGRILEPLRSLTDTTRAISESDLKQRIPVTGTDEVARLAAQFNAMLDRLERAFDTQRRLLDDVGHELRTPITVIRGHLELLGDDPEERAETMKVVMEELDRMSRMVDNVLSLAKAERPDFLQLQTVDMAALTSSLLTKARTLAARRWELDGTARALVVADGQWLTQALMQLAQNAAQNTTEGDEIALGSAVSDGEARFWVRDTGPGIPAEDQDRIWRRFYSGNRRRTTSDGAGLGLSIVRAIAEAHHGRVELDSAPGKGATFTIVIPVDQPESAEGLGA